MDVQLLVIEDCPHAGSARVLLRRALDDVGLVAVPIRTQVITEQAQAEALGFGGSPTFLVEGRDPFTEPVLVAALACRLYRTADGLAGLPELELLRQALKQAADLD